MMIDMCDENDNMNHRTKQQHDENQQGRNSLTTGMLVFVPWTTSSPSSLEPSSVPRCCRDVADSGFGFLGLLPPTMSSSPLLRLCFFDAPPGLFIVLLVVWSFSLPPAAEDDGFFLFGTPSPRLTPFVDRGFDESSLGSESNLFFLFVAMVQNGHVLSRILSCGEPMISL